jgi:uncharacterized membrane protein YhaH (DUF805 family)
MSRRARFWAAAIMVLIVLVVLGFNLGADAPSDGPTP